jgi:hypothetical protein
MPAVDAVDAVDAVESVTTMPAVTTRYPTRTTRASRARYADGLSRDVVVLLDDVRGLCVGAEELAETPPSKPGDGD